MSLTRKKNFTINIHHLLHSIHFWLNPIFPRIASKKTPINMIICLLHVKFKNYTIGTTFHHRINCLISYRYCIKNPSSLYKCSLELKIFLVIEFPNKPHHFVFHKVLAKLSKGNGKAI